MDATLSAAAGFFGGLVLGGILALLVMSSRAKGVSRYACWLGTTCWVRPISRPRWEPHVVVAVSWKGAVCVRHVGALDKDGHWIKKQNVAWRVRWVEPPKAS